MALCMILQWFEFGLAPSYAHAPHTVITLHPMHDCKNGTAKQAKISMAYSFIHRPLSDEALRVSTPVVVTCNDQRREVSVAQNIANKEINRTVAFDKVLGPKSQQQDVFNHAVVPLVSENDDLPTDVGVIPSAVKRIFDILEAQSAEYNMKMIAIRYHEARRGEQGPPLRLLLRQAAAAKETVGDESKEFGRYMRQREEQEKQEAELFTRALVTKHDKQIEKRIRRQLHGLGGLTDGFGLGMNMLLGGDKEDDGGSRKSHGKSGN
ncbi:hypothetical protein ZEAMMB73_Zm00001d038383 [Zea mays]|uniref:Uncharacterized protein n=1 Tax=Zea mays TaxID=4577 RepID=A0A1D6M5Y1_MAIZE|nr:hypothetical protein ZEAMMB73_Zm00001d038383 [Zea mays]